MITIDIGRRGTIGLVVLGLLVSELIKFNEKRIILESYEKTLLEINIFRKKVKFLFCQYFCQFFFAKKLEQTKVPKTLFKQQNKTCIL